MVATAAIGAWSSAALSSAICRVRRAVAVEGITRGECAGVLEARNSKRAGLDGSGLGELGSASDGGPRLRRIPKAASGFWSLSTACSRSRYVSTEGTRRQPNV